MRRGESIGLLTLLLLAGCGSEPLPAPTLQAACQARFPGRCVDWLYAGERVPLRVVGTGLLAPLSVDLGAGGVSTPVEGFALDAGGVPLEAVALVRGSRAEAGTLYAEVPPLLPVGRHALALLTPAGLEAELPDALEVRSPLRLRATLDRVRLAVGERADLTVVVGQDGLGSLSGVALALTAEPPGLVTLPTAPAPRGLGPESSRTLVLPVTGVASGVVRLRIRAAGLTAEGLPVDAEAPGEASLEIR